MTCYKKLLFLGRSRPVLNKYTSLPFVVIVLGGLVFIGYSYLDSIGFLGFKKKSTVASLNTSEDSKSPRPFDRSKSLEESLTRMRDLDLALNRMESVCDNFKIPPIVHVVWFYGKNAEMSFVQYISLRSTLLFAKPARILFWHDYEPNGMWWDDFLLLIERQNRTVLVMSKREPPVQIYGKWLQKFDTQAVVAKFQALLAHGGIYLDLDLVLIRSLDPLRCRDFVMAQYDHHTFTEALLMSAPHSDILRGWFKSVREIETEDENTIPVVLLELYKANPERIRPVKSCLADVDPFTRTSVTRDMWGRVYGVHVEIYGYLLKAYDPQSIKTMNTTAAEVMRYIYYGSRDII